MTVKWAPLMLGCTLAVSAHSPKFAGFDAKTDDGESPTFHLSDADATSSSPVVLSIPGRRLTNADRIYRVNLQKIWLSKYVPKALTFRSRSLVECAYKRRGEYPFCDLYEFEDESTGKQVDYYIYVGNWP